MCRLLGYLGSSIQLDRILIKPEHSLVVQSYKPQEMTAGLLNADGFGLAGMVSPIIPLMLTKISYRFGMMPTYRS